MSTKDLPSYATGTGAVSESHKYIIDREESAHARRTANGRVASEHHGLRDVTPERQRRRAGRCVTGHKMVITIRSRNSLIEWTTEDVDGGWQSYYTGCILLRVTDSTKSPPSLLMSQTLPHLCNLVARGFSHLAHSLTISANAARTAAGISFELSTQEYGAETQPEIYTCSLAVYEPQRTFVSCRVGSWRRTHRTSLEQTRHNLAEAIAVHAALPSVQILPTSTASACCIKLLCQFLDLLFYRAVFPDAPVPPETLSVRRINAEQA